jgi:coproporphyrinogen III oxidase-like Fe-S oxidoreductase
LAKEIRLRKWSDGENVETIYFGGTPSVLSSIEIDFLIAEFIKIIQL